MSIFNWIQPRFPRPKPIPLGVVIPTPSKIISQIQFLVPESLVQTWVQWDENEVSPGNYVWLDGIKYGIPALRKAGYNNIGFSISITPAFYRDSPIACYEPRPEHYIDYAKFCLAAVKEFRPSFIEIWREPDIPPEWVSTNPDYTHSMGGFGNTFEAGRRYGRMLKEVYRLIKPKFPKTTIVAGSLCTPYGASLDFLRGMQGEAGEMCDAISFHRYVTPDKSSWDWPFVHIPKLRKITKKPVWLTETSLLYSEDADVNRNLQAEYFQNLLNKAPRNQLKNILWLCLANNNWMHADLVEHDVKKPAWYVYANYLSNLLVK